MKKISFLLFYASQCFSSAAPIKNFFEEQKQLYQSCIRPVTYRVKLNEKIYNRYVWTMPKGYLLGGLLSFANSHCRAKNPPPSLGDHFKRLRSAPQDSNDSLLRIPPIFNSHKRYSPHVLSYSLLLSLGMIESSGNPHEGMYLGDYYLSAETAEAGLFQISYNSVGSIVPSKDYLALTNTHAENDIDNEIKKIFYWGLKERDQASSPSWGQGKGYDFQEQMKNNPTLAFEYAASLIRRSTTHHGPIIRKESQHRSACTELLEELRQWLDQNPSSCNHLASEIKELNQSNFLNDYVLNVDPNPLQVTQNDYSRSLSLPKLSVLGFVVREVEEDLRKNPISIKAKILEQNKRLLKTLKAELNTDGRSTIPIPNYIETLNIHSSILADLRAIDPNQRLFLHQRYLEVQKLMKEQGSIESMRSSSSSKLKRLESFMAEQENHVSPEQWKLLQKEHLLRKSEKLFWDGIDLDPSALL